MAIPYDSEPGETEQWRGRQWSVTTHALQCQSTRAEITFDRLAKQDGHSWPEHMAEKTWIDLDDFVQAYLIACVASGTQIADIADVIRRAQAKAAGQLAAAKVAAELYPADDMNPADIDGFFKIHGARKDAEDEYRETGGGKVNTADMISSEQRRTST